MVNGLYLTLKKLEKCVAYVPKHADIGPDMSVRQTLLFTSLLQEPDNNRGFDTKSRVSLLNNEFCFFFFFFYTLGYNLILIRNRIY